MNTLGTTTKNVVKKEEQYAINHGFVAASALQRGQVVKFNATTGEVEPIAAATDKPFGIVTAGGGAGERVTVQTQFSIILNAIASGTVALGAKVAATGVSGAYNTVATATAGQTATAVALTAGADTDEITIGVLRGFVAV